MFKKDALSDIIEINGNYYFVHSCYTPDHGYETMVFPCDSKGNEVDYDTVVYENRYPNKMAMIQHHIAIGLKIIDIT